MQPKLLEQLQPSPGMGLETVFRGLGQKKFSSRPHNSDPGFKWAPKIGVQACNPRGLRNASRPSPMHRLPPPPPCHRRPPPSPPPPPLRVFLGLVVPHPWEKGEEHQLAKITAAAAAVAAATATAGPSLGDRFRSGRHGSGGATPARTAGCAWATSSRSPW
jgi:hypothetical protein